MVIENEYDEIISRTLKSVDVRGKYAFPRSSKTIQIEEQDLNNFKKLYNETGGNQTIGYGEIALYWLYGGRLKPCPDVDLKCGNYKIDVKSYTENGYLTLGKWKDNIKTRNIVNNIFSCYNLTHDDFKSELNFSTCHLEDALRSNIWLYSTLDSMYKSLTKLGSCPLSKIHDTLGEMINEFKLLSKARGRQFIPLKHKNVDSIVEESIADIIYGLVHYKLFESNTGIGDKGYIVNVVKNGEGATGDIQIHRAKGLKTNSTPLLENFNVTSGEIKIKPDILVHV